MASFLKMFDQKCWEQDVTFYWRYKKLAEEATTPRIVEMCEKRMEELQAKWPNHPME